MPRGGTKLYLTSESDMGYANTIDESPVTVTKLQQMKQKGENSRF
jgi:hypothetical protein